MIIKGNNNKTNERHVNDIFNHRFCTNFCTHAENYNRKDHQNNCSTNRICDNSQSCLLCIHLYMQKRKYITRINRRLFSRILAATTYSRLFCFWYGSFLRDWFVEHTKCVVFWFFLCCWFARFTFGSRFRFY